MTTLKQSVSLWRKLAKARGMLSEVLNELPQEANFYRDLKRDIRKILKETAARPPADLDLDAYQDGRTVRRSGSSSRKRGP